ncbi:MAG: hypothetical protein J6M34_07650 [Clostridia bacterium]|nr:hypothetical protein [Clostridia bacterium]
MEFEHSDRYWPYPVMDEILVVPCYLGPIEKEKDQIIIYNPHDTVLAAPKLPHSKKTLEEHIEYIQKNNIKHAFVAAEDIHFLPRCHNLEHLQITPSLYAEDFDYSPLYEMKNLKRLLCHTVYKYRPGPGIDEERVANIDYSRIPGLKCVTILGEKGNLNIDKANGLTSLCLAECPLSDNLQGFVPQAWLESFSVCESAIRSLDGIERARKVRRLELSVNRRLMDISALRHIKDHLIYLEIDLCGKIRDFSVLSELQNLQFLVLKGSNPIPDLSFLKDLPNLKVLHLTMNVVDGDLSWCESIPYVRIQNRKHYSHKDKDFPKDNYTDPNKVCPDGTVDSTPPTAQ